MHFKAFHAEFEKIARRQTRSLSIRGEPGIPDGDYAFLPMYCKDKTCDCRRTLINVLQVSPEYGPFHAATISYGWEPLSFYRDWAGALSEEEIKAFKGPALDVFNTQSPSAPYLLESFKNIVLDEVYAERIKRQYAMFKYKAGMKLPPELLKQGDFSGGCPCESGRPFMLCCGRSRRPRRRRR